MSALHKWYVKKGLCEGPLGFPCREDDARELEALVKEAEDNGGGYVRHFFASDLEVNKAVQEQEPRHTLLLTASTEQVDRDQEVMDLSGMNLKYYNRNPVVCYAHDKTMPPVGRALWTKVQGNVLKSLAKLADRPADWPPVEWFPDLLFALAEQKILRGVSVGAIVTDLSPPTEKELKARPELAACRRILRKSVLTEISLVPVGANQGALVEQVNKGYFPKETFKHLGIDEPQAEADLWSWTTQDCLPPAEAAPAKSKDLKQDILKRFAAGLNKT